MKSLDSYSLFFFLLLASSALAQQDLVELEKEIKSGNYIYVQAIGINEEDAKIRAKELLFKNNEFLSNMEQRKLNFSDIEINYFLKPTERGVRCIAYISKTEVTVQKHLPFKDNKQVNQSLLPQSTVEIKNNTDQHFLPGSLDFISKNISCVELWDKLNILKREGVLVFSTRQDAFDDPNDCYLITCGQSGVLDFYNKGSDIRFNYLENTTNKQSIITSSTDKIIIYVYIF